MSQLPNTGRFEGNERFQVLSLLGRGGMGVVYEVYDRERQAKVALKTLNEGSPVELLRLKAEFRALQELEHPNLISLGELFEEQGQWFFTMELIEGENFIKYIRTPEDEAGGVFIGGDTSENDPSGEKPKPGRLIFDEQKLRDSLVQLCGALEALHGTHRVHRDVKPENVLVQADGRVVLLDFGLVTQSDPGQLSVHYQPVGTAAYMAPEQAASLQVGPEADWYAVGVLLFEALTGTPPFTGTFSQVLLAKHAKAVPHPRDLNATVPEDLDQLCMALLQHEPAKRPRGEDVIRVLRKKSLTAESLSLSMGTRAPVFVGRQRELDWMMEGQADVSSQGLVTLLLHGASGLGKSELLRTAGREMLLKDPRMLILWGRCNERESVSYKAFDGVVDALSRFLAGLPEKEVAQLIPRNVDLLVRVFPVLTFLREVDSSGSGRACPVMELQEVRSQAFSALRELLTRLADRRPVVLVLDDIQWADEDSIKLLRSLMQPPDAPAVLFVLSMRTPTDEADATDMVSRFHCQLPSRPQDLRLGPLSPEASAMLVEELLASNPDLQAAEHAQAKFISGEAAGHPLYIHELVHQVQMSGPADLGRVFKLDDVLWARIGALEPGLRQVVELVSVSFGPLRQDVAGLALGVKPAEVFRMAARLRVLHLVRTSGPGAEDLVEPYHDRVREAVQARLEEGVKLAWHETLARVLRAARNVEPERLAAHLEVIGEKQQAAEHLTEAADHAASALAFDRAAGLYERAIQLRWQDTSDPDLPIIRELTIRMGNALANAGRGREAARALLDAVPGARAADALELKRKAAEQLLTSGFLDEGIEATAQVLRSIRVRMPRTSFGALFSLLWHRFRLWIRGTRFKERDETQVTPADLVKIDILHSVARGLGGTDHIRGADFNTRYLLAALKTGEPHRVLAAMSLEANYAAGFAPDSAYAHRMLASCELLQHKLRDPKALAYIQSAHGYANFMRGNWADAQKYAESSLGMMSEFGGTYWERGMNNNQTFWSLFYLGELSEMSRRLPSVLQNAMDRGDLFSASGLVMGLCNVLVLNQYGPQRAAQGITEMLSRWTLRGYHLQHYWGLLSRVQIRLYTGEVEEAHSLVQRDWKPLKSSLLLQVPAVRNEGLHLRARATLACAAQSGGKRRTELLKLAKKDFTRLNKGKLPWVRALGPLVEAGYRALTSDDAAARGCLALAIERLDACEMKLYAAAARIRLGTLVGGDEGRTILEQGRAFMTAQGVKEESCMVAMLAPGFPANEAERKLI